MTTGQYWIEAGILFGVGLVGWLASAPLFVSSIALGVRIAAADSGAVEKPEDAATVGCIAVVQQLAGQFAYLLFAVTVGLLAAHAIGLGAPLLEAHIEGVLPDPFGQATLQPLLLRGVAIGAALGILGLVFNAMTKFSRGNAGIWALNRLVPTWQRILLIANVGYGQIAELSAVAVVAWLIGRAWHGAGGVPATGAYWTAIAVFALFTAVTQASGLAQIKRYMDVSGLTIALAGLLGIVSAMVFGYLLWHDGLELAIVAAFTSSIITTLLGR